MKQKKFQKKKTRIIKDSRSQTNNKKKKARDIE